MLSSGSNLDKIKKFVGAYREDHAPRTGITRTRNVRAHALPWYISRYRTI